MTKQRFVKAEVVSAIHAYTIVVLGAYSLFVADPYFPKLVMFPAVILLVINQGIQFRHIPRLVLGIGLSIYAIYLLVEPIATAYDDHKYFPLTIMGIMFVLGIVATLYIVMLFYQKLRQGKK